MPKRLNISDEEHYKLMELKGKYAQKTLYNLLVLLDKLAQKALIGIDGDNDLISPPTICICGHSETHHKDGDDSDQECDRCNCKQFEGACVCGHSARSHVKDGKFVNCNSCVCEAYDEAVEEIKK